MGKMTKRLPPIRYAGEQRRRIFGNLAVALFLLTTHLPGVLVLATPQIFARVGPGVSQLPLTVTAFSDPSFGDISDAVNVASGNAYVDLGQVNRNNSTSTAAPSSSGTLLTNPTNNSSSLSGTMNVSGVFRLNGFNTTPTTPVPTEFSLGVGDGSQQLYRQASEDEIQNGPTWIKERYAGYRVNTTTQYFISKPQVSVQTDETWLMVVTLGNNRRIAHYYDHSGNRTTFYGDGEYADFTQTPHEQYRAANYQSDFEGIGATAPKTEFSYTAAGNGHLRKIKDSWGRVTTYSWDEAAGVVMAVNMLLKDENDDNSWMKRVEYAYEIANNQRVVTYMVFRTEDGRGNRIGRWFDLSYRLGTNNEVLLYQITRPVLDNANAGTLGAGGGKTTTYTYDTQNRVTRTSTLGEPDTTFAYGQSPAATGAGGLEVTQLQGDKKTLYQFSPEGWLRNRTERNYNPVTLWDYSPTTTNPWNGQYSMSWYDAYGRVVAQSQPDGSQVQRTFDRHGNLKTEAMYSPPVAWADPPPVGYQKLTRYTYNNDNEVTKTIQEAMNGQGNSNGTMASDAAYDYGQVVKNYAYLKHTSPVNAWAVVSANRTVTEDLYISGTLKRQFHTGIDVYGRVSNTVLFVDGNPYKTVDYAYHAEGATAGLVYPSNMTVVPYDRDKSVRQYADQVYAKSSNGVRTEYIYDEYGNVARELIPNSHVYAWNGATAVKGHIHHWTMYNGFGQPVWESKWEYQQEKDSWPQMISRQWLYYNSGELDAMWDGGIGNVTDYRYNDIGGSADLGRITAVVQGIGTASAFGVATPHKTTILTYDTYGRPKTETVDGFTTTKTYTTLDQVAKITYPDNSSIEFQTHASGLPYREINTNVDGQTQVVYHLPDGMGREYQTEYVGNGVSQGTVKTYYDAFDRPVKITDNRLNTNGSEASRSTYFKYDTAGNLIHKLDPMLTTAGGQPYTDTRRPYVMMSYDKLDRPIGKCQLLTGTINDPNTMTITGNANCPWTTAQYDVFDRVIQSTDQDGYFTKLSYDNSNNVITTERQVWLGNASEPSRDSVNMGFNSVITRTAYDGAGRPVQQIDGRGNIKKTEYNIFGPVWLTDERGQKIKNIWYTSDGLFQGSSEPTDDGGDTFVVTELREYDSRQYPARIFTAYQNNSADSGSGARTDYTYDHAGHPLTTQLPPDQAGTRATITQTYHNNGQPRSITDANGFTTNFTYDWDGKLTKKDELARPGNQTDINAGLASGLTNSYVYDTAGNLTKKTEHGLITEYKYNTLGKVISESRPRVGESTATNWKLTTYNLYGLPTAQTSYDYAGNLTSVPDVIDPWDTRVTHNAGNMTMAWYYARGIKIGEVSWGYANGARTWEYTKNMFVNGLGQNFLRKFWGSTSVYAEQRSSTGALLGTGNVLSYWQYDENGNLRGKWDTPGNTNNEAPLDVNNKQNVFTYTYTPTNKEATSARNIQVRVRGAVPNNVLNTTYGGTNGIVLAASILNTSNQYNRRDQLRRTDTTEQSPYLDGNTPPRQDSIGNTVTRHQHYSYYHDGKVNTSWTGNGSTDEAYKTTELYDKRGREIQVYDSNGQQYKITPARVYNTHSAARVYSTYSADGITTNRIEQDGKTIYQNIVTSTVGGLVGINAVTTYIQRESFTPETTEKISKTVYTKSGSLLTGVPYDTTYITNYTSSALINSSGNCIDYNDSGERTIPCPTPQNSNKTLVNTYSVFDNLLSTINANTNANILDSQDNFWATYDNNGYMTSETKHNANTDSLETSNYILDSRGN